MWFLMVACTNSTKMTAASTISAASKRKLAVTYIICRMTDGILGNLFE